MKNKLCLIHTVSPFAIVALCAKSVTTLLWCIRGRKRVLTRAFDWCSSTTVHHLIGTLGKPHIFAHQTGRQEVSPRLSAVRMRCAASIWCRCARAVRSEQISLPTQTPEICLVFKNHKYTREKKSTIATRTHSLSLFCTLSIC